MAQRSIPMYADVHKMHARFIIEDFLKMRSPLPRRGAPYRLLDIGASTGYLFQKLHDMETCNPGFRIEGVEIYAVDPSRAMLEIIESRYPQVHVYCIGAEEIGTLGVRFDAVAMHYVLQFIAEERHPLVLDCIYKVLKPRGLFLYAHKEAWITEFAPEAEEHYIDFRRSRGYTDKEIAAKTHALKNSMWPQTQYDTKQRLRSAGFGDIQETMRWGVFSSLVCRSDG